MRWPNNYQTFFILFNPVDLPGRTVKYQAAVYYLPLDLRSVQLVANWQLHCIKKAAVSSLPL
jgi:hypothetical protein